MIPVVSSVRCLSPFESRIFSCLTVRNLFTARTSLPRAACSFVAPKIAGSICPSFVLIRKSGLGLPWLHFHSKERARFALVLFSFERAGSVCPSLIFVRKRGLGLPLSCSQLKSPVSVCLRPVAPVLTRLMARAESTVPLMCLVVRAVI